MIVQDLGGEDGAVSGASLWSSALFDWSLVLAKVTLVAWLLFFLAVSLQGAGAWLTRWLVPGGSRLADWIRFRLPWTHKRMQRDFSAMLTLLLDHAVPEETSIRLAVESTDNGSFLRRANRAVDDLRAGAGIAEAMRWLDDAGEFRWRLLNAGKSEHRFASALAGWHEALAAKAFQEEQLFSQALSTGFVLLNGLMVGLATAGVFKALVGITELALW